MKKILLILCIGLLFISSCTKEKCNCGLIVDDRAIDYAIKVRNDCSMREQWFTLQPGDWMNAHPGDKWCFSNIDSW